MTSRIEWRTRGKGKDALLYVGQFGEDANTVLKIWEGDTDVLADFLNDMREIDTNVTELQTDVDERDPAEWGNVVMARSVDGGDIVDINPELYWDAIYYWFRAKGRDPHPWTAQHRG